MSNLPTTFVPHTSEEDLGFSGAWRPMLSPAVVEAGIKLMVLSKQTKDDNITGVIMPSHDWSISPFDPSFSRGVAPHMSRTPDPKKTVHFVANPWAMPWKCYTFQGPMNEHFISPSNRAKMIGGDAVDKDLLADAFDDIYLFIKRSPKFDKQAKDYYLTKPDMNTDARVPLVERKYFGNFLVRDKERKQDTHVVLCFTSAAYHYYIEQMRWATRFGGTPVDQNWPAYLIGDPTNPAGALVWHQEKMLVGGLKMESNVMCFTQEPEVMAPNPERRVISSDQLAARVNLYDPNSWNWPSYQDMVDFALEYWTEVPRDLIADACSHRAVVGHRAKKSEVFDGGGAPRGGVGADAPAPTSGVAFRDPTPPPQSQPVSQPAAAPQPAAAAPAPTPQAGEDRWVCGAVTSGAVVKWPVPKILEFAASGQLTNEMINKDGVWVPFADAGFPALAPVVTAPPPAPSAPAAPAAPSAPAAAAPVVPNSELQAEIDKYVPTYHSMPAERQEKVRDVVSRIMAHTASNPSATIPQELTLSLGQLLMGG